MTGRIYAVAVNTFREAIRRDLRERLAARIETGAGIDRSPELLVDSRPKR